MITVSADRPLRPRPPRGRPLLAAGAVAMGLLGLAGCASASSPGVGPHTPATSRSTGTALRSAPTITSPTNVVPTAPTAERDPGYLHRIATGGTPCATLGAAGSVWVADISRARVSRLDPKTGKVTAQIRTGTSPCGMAYGADSIWVEDYGADDVTRISLPSLDTTRYRVGSMPYDVAFAAGAAWVTNFGDGTVTRVDAATGRGTTIRVGISPVGIAPSDGALWVSNQGDGTVSRIDAATLRVTTVKTGGTPGWTAYDAHTVWVGDASAGQVIRIDSRTGRIVARVDVGPAPNDGDVYDGVLWVPDATNGLYRVDPATNTATGPFRLGAADPFVADGFDGRLWIADFKGTETFVVDLARLSAR